MLALLQCNVSYNGLFIFPVSEEAATLGFANDLTIVVTANHPEGVEVYVTETVTLADEKT